MYGGSDDVLGEAFQRLRQPETEPLTVAAAATIPRPLVAEAAVIVLVLVAAGLFLWGMDANADKDRAKAAAADAQARLQARSAGPKTYDYVIFAGEDEPGEYSTFDSDWAYPRVAPDVSALGVTENRVEIGTHVRVIRQLEIGGLRWFQLESRDFVHGAVARAAPHSGESEAPNCLDAPEEVVRQDCDVGERALA